MTHHPSLVARQEAFAGDADPWKKKVERAVPSLANPVGRESVL
jgi:hypothetical protein